MPKFIYPTPLKDFLIFYGIKYDNIEIEMEKYKIDKIECH